MNLEKLIDLYIKKKTTEIQAWLENERINAGTQDLTDEQLCAGVLLGRESVLGIRIDQNYLNTSVSRAGHQSEYWFCIALYGNIDALYRAINDGQFDPNTLKINRGATVWHYLAKGGHIDALYRAINDGKLEANTQKDYLGATVWHHLADAGHIDALYRAINDRKFDRKNHKDYHGATVWHHLGGAGHIDALYRAMNDHKFDRKNHKDYHGATVWHYLAQGGHIDALYRAINDEKFNPKSKTIQDKDLLTVWHYLAYGGHIVALCRALNDGKFNPEIFKYAHYSEWGCIANHNLDEFYRAIYDGKFDPYTNLSSSQMNVWKLLDRIYPNNLFEYEWRILNRPPSYESLLVVDYTRHPQLAYFVLKHKLSLALAGSFDQDNYTYCLRRFFLAANKLNKMSLLIPYLNNQEILETINTAIINDNVDLISRLLDRLTKHSPDHIEAITDLTVHLRLLEAQEDMEPAQERHYMQAFTWLYAQHKNNAHGEDSSQAFTFKFAAEIDSLDEQSQGSTSSSKKRVRMI